MVGLLFHRFLSRLSYLSISQNVPGAEETNPSRLLIKMKPSISIEDIRKTDLQYLIDRKVLKDGDLIEADANKGIVKKL